MIQVDISNVWNRVSLSDLLGMEAELTAAHQMLMEGTGAGSEYLGWLDLRAYGFHEEELAQRTIAAGVQFTGGTFFGDNGDGFLRINIGCPRRYITEGILRLKKALEG